MQVHVPTLSFENPLDDDIEAQDSALPTYVTTAKATVRNKVSVSSKEVRVLEPGTIVTVIKQRNSGGHRRAQIGDGEWISLVTKRGRVLAVPQTAS